jgi:ABC-type multidrug transport system fused ATPase/permease subunit
VKHLIAWILTAIWALWLLFAAWNYINSFVANFGPGTMNWMQLHAAIGATVLGLAPLWAAWQWHRFSQKRMHKTLTKQRNKIDRKLERLGTKPGSADPFAKPSDSAPTSASDQKYGTASAPPE